MWRVSVQAPAAPRLWVWPGVWWPRPALSRRPQVGDAISFMVTRCDLNPIKIFNISTHCVHWHGAARGLTLSMKLNRYPGISWPAQPGTQGAAKVFAKIFDCPDAVTMLLSSLLPSVMTHYSWHLLLGWIDTHTKLFFSLSNFKSTFLWASEKKTIFCAENALSCVQSSDAILTRVSPYQVCRLQVPELSPVRRPGSRSRKGRGPGPQSPPGVCHWHHQVCQAGQRLHLQPHIKGHRQDHERQHQYSTVGLITITMSSDCFFIILLGLGKYGFMIRNFRFQLISFNDYGREINRNVRLEVWSHIQSFDLM